MTHCLMLFTRSLEGHNRVICVLTYAWENLGIGSCDNISCLLQYVATAISSLLGHLDVLSEIISQELYVVRLSTFFHSAENMN